MIDDQFIGNINGLKLELDLKKGAFETYIKSLNKAAIQTIGPEINKRIDTIIATKLIELNDYFKFYWNGCSVAKLSVGNDYLNPNIDLIIDDIVDQNQKHKLSDFINKWTQNKINTVLKNLIDLKNHKEKNSSVKALA